MMTQFAQLKLFCSAVADSILEGKADANLVVVKDDFVEADATAKTKDQPVDAVNIEAKDESTTIKSEVVQVETQATE